MPHPGFVEVFLYICPVCQTVRGGRRPLAPGQHSVGLLCNTCNTNVKHKPLAYDPKSQKFLTTR